VTLTGIAHGVILAWGYKRALIALLAGALSTLALAPFHLWPVMFLTIPVAVWLIDGSVAGRWGRSGAAAIAGWWFGFGYCLAGLYWVGHAFLVDAKTFGWLMPFAVVALPAGLAFFYGLGFALARILWPRGALRVLTLAAALTLAEWLRGHVLTGFPWNALGYGLAGPLVLAQTGALVGLWGLTFIAVAVFASPAVLADDKTEAPQRWWAPAWAGLLLLALAGYGAARLWTTPTSFAEGVSLRIMQPHVPQDEKFNYAAKQGIMDRYATLSQRTTAARPNGLKGVTLLVWPESAFPFFLTREPEALAAIAKLVPDGTTLITGAVRLAESQPRGDSVRAYNSVYMIGHDGTILSVYDKVHLVPFGEYLPFQDTLERLGLMQLTKVKGGFLAGNRRRPIRLDGAPTFAPMICYEIIFPGEAISRSERPDWLVNVTNDGWFGLSPGPYQHFQQARLRAIEEGLPVVRAANTGISAVIDPLGRILESLPLGGEGVVDSNLPHSVAPTPYVRAGDGPVAAIVFLTFVISQWRRKRYP
jgi:apolipoprotein N-acyltransferase